MPRWNRKECARVVVEANGVVEAGRFRRHLAESPHAFGRIVEPPGGAELQARIMAGKRRELARVSAFIEGKQDDRQARVISEAIEQWLQGSDVVRSLWNVGALIASKRLVQPAVMVAK